MIKRKIKLSLIDDYIKIAESKNILDYYLTNNNINRSNCKYVADIAKELTLSYEKLLFKFNLMDDSLLVLKKELNCQANLFSPNFCKQHIEFSIKTIKQIYFNFLDKIEKLSLNKVEKFYIARGVKSFNA